MNIKPRIKKGLPGSSGSVLCQGHRVISLFLNSLWPSFILKAVMFLASRATAVVHSSDFHKHSCS